MKMFDRFKHKRNESLQYADGLGGYPFWQGGKPKTIRLPGRNEDGTPRVK
ncbi:MAG: hypothetical protein FWH47_00820 [Methanomassiliicoccaceae archaeon]|nr:hypothetical protein [Methanomassiliicoccaceae archaeon]